MTLARLIEAVEAGAATMNDFAAAFPSETAYGPTTWGGAYKAYNGSLDAAKRLHDALLPGWRIGQIGQAYASQKETADAWRVWIVAPDFLESCEQSEAFSANPARAWLLAILRAMEGRDG